MLYREDGKDIGIDTGVGSKKSDFARKKIIFKPISDNIDIMIGNHTVHFENRKVFEVEKNDFIVREYSFRTYEQFRDKVKRADIIFKKNKLFKNNRGLATHWRNWLEVFEKDNLKDFYQNKIYFDKNRFKEAIGKGILVYDNTLEK